MIETGERTGAGSPWHHRLHPGGQRVTSWLKGTATSVDCKPPCCLGPLRLLPYRLGGPFRLISGAFQHERTYNLWTGHVALNLARPAD